MPLKYRQIQIIARTAALKKQSRIVQRIYKAAEQALLKHKGLSKRNRQQLTKTSMIAILLTGDREIKKLNRDFRNKDKETDILSFAPTESESIGELVLNLKIVSKQAREHDLSFEGELFYLLVHGILHLLGYDHSEKMFRMQDEIFQEWLLNQARS